MSDAARIEQRSLTPNHLAKRDAIVDSAVRVLLERGVSGCTVRAVAQEAGISKGVVHYYFDDVDQMVDGAMRRAVELWVEVLAGVASGDEVDGPARFWAAMDACRRPFAHGGDRTLMPLWFEYWTQSTRRGRLETLRHLQGLLVDAVERLLLAAQVDRSHDRAVAVTAYLFGVSVHQGVEPIGDDLVDRDLALLSGVGPR